MVFCCHGVYTDLNTKCIVQQQNKHVLKRAHRTKNDMHGSAYRRLKKAFNLSQNTIKILVSLDYKKPPQFML